MPAADPWALWGSVLSPFALKIEALLRVARVPYRWVPASGPFPVALRHAVRRQRVVTHRLPLTWPRMTPLDEFPQVPFLFGPGGENLYDSSAIGAWLADRFGAPCLLPEGDPALRFAVRLIDEACDELGLPLVHHNRWVHAARDNDAGERLAREVRPLVGPLARVVRHAFPARQVRRLPYLLSVAPAGSTRWNDLPRRLRPPARDGFPPTHALLDETFAGLLAAVEPVLSTRAGLFGETVTLADASLYGQLGMNRSDPSAWESIRRRAPATARWVDRLAGGDVPRGGEATLDAGIGPLLAWCTRTFVPLMQQNHAAWRAHCAAGETRFNERAFDAGRALYDGTLAGHPFRAVVKTFQVQVWLDLRRDWDALAEADRRRLAALVPADHGLDRDEPPDAPRIAPS